MPLAAPLVTSPIIWASSTTIRKNNNKTQKQKQNAIGNVTEVVKKDVEFIAKGIGQGFQWANKALQIPKLTKSVDNFIWLRHVEDPRASVTVAPSWPNPHYPELSGVDLFVADFKAMEAYLTYFYCLSKLWTKPLPETYDPEQVSEYFNLRPHVVALRLLEDWELDELFDLYRVLEGFTMNSQISDSLRWGSSSKGKYTVKAGYVKLCASNSMIENWPWKLIWRSKVPTKVMCFSWTAVKNAISTQDNLSRKNFQLANRCYVCQTCTESVNHLFLHCSVAAQMWHMFLAIFGISWSTPQNLKEAFESWGSWAVDKTINNIWQMIPACICWCIWTERNSRCFDGISTPISFLKSKCLMSLFSWSNLHPVNDVITLLDFISSLYLA